MQRMTWMWTMGIMSAGVVLLSLSPVRAAATRPPGVPMQEMQGHITAIATSSNMVVIEVQKERDQFTLKAPLSTRAVIKKGGKLVLASALHVGDQVRVQWEQTAAGHHIVQLEASQGYLLKSPLERTTRVLRSV